MRQLILCLALVLAAAPPAAAQDVADGKIMQTGIRLVDFGAPASGDWAVINDGVMGGLSRSGMRRTAEGTGVFAGVLSLENSGGFASVRTTPLVTDLTACSGFAVRVRGDGRSYQLRLRTDDAVDGIAYQALFATRAGEWTELEIPFASFEPTFRGRRPAGAPPLDLSRIRQLGFLLADGKPGAFSLEIDSVRAR